MLLTDGEQPEIMGDSGWKIVHSLEIEQKLSSKARLLPWPVSHAATQDQGHLRQKPNKQAARESDHLECAPLLSEAADATH